jgi:transposase
MKLDRETRMTISVLSRSGQSGRAIGRMLGVDEKAVRYHLRRAAEGAVDGRSLQAHKAAGLKEAIVHYLEQQEEGPPNLAALHEWLVGEHDFTGSLRGVQRYFRRHFPRPAKRARRRVETPPGAQAQADWAEWPRVWIAGRPVYAYQFHLRLSHSRYGARVWSPRADQLAWHDVHNHAFRRLEGVPATVRVDNTKTAVSRGAGAWGELNPSYRRYAKAVRFHIDACPVHHPEAKGKVERGIGADRAWREVAVRDWSGWDELQAWTDERVAHEAQARTCPATGTSVWAAWQAERPKLAAVPLLPEPFDLAVTRTVAPDCTVAFEARRYSVPFAHLGRAVTVHGCSRVVQVWANGRVIAEHPRQGRERIVIDPRHYEGEATDTVLPPLPLGRMGRRLQELLRLTPQQRPLDLYAALAEVAR